ncbi:MAG: hypothetical protein V1743_04375 [Nanoarchaeota archaeon]
MITCVYCRGKYPEELCKNGRCPVLMRFYAKVKKNSEGKQDFFGAAPNVFIGRYGYPNVSAGILGNELVTEEHDNPRVWAEKNYDIDKIVDLRTSLINSQFRTHIKSFNDRFLEMTREVSMAEKPVDMEVSLEKKPVFRLTVSQDVTPFGPSVRLKNARITENPKVPVSVEKAVGDSDLKAGNAIGELYRKGLGEHHLTKLISTGSLGLKTQRKLVPTRWSITAIDDTLGKQMIDEIRDFRPGEYAAYFGGYLGNYYLNLFFPDVWSYELFEMMAPKTPQHMNWDMVTTDYEGYEGRKDYAANTVGGYYAARLGILEALKKSKRQASVLALRFITDEYYTPLGVWVVRQASRNAMSVSPQFFSSREELMNYARQFVSEKFKVNLDELLQRSILYQNLKKQRKISEFFR